MIIMSNYRNNTVVTTTKTDIMYLNQLRERYNHCASDFKQLNNLILNQAILLERC